MLPKDFILAQIMFLARYTDYGEYMTNLPFSSSQALFVHGGSKKPYTDFFFYYYYYYYFFLIFNLFF